jgi:uncharacterized protein (TIGR00255 family)
LLLSMTGFGEAICHRDGLTISAEIRAVNNRYLKLSTRISEGYASLEPHIETLVRKRVRRGTVQVTIRVDRLRTADECRLNVEVLESYRRQIEAFCERWQPGRPVPLESLLMLPGVVAENVAAAHDPAQDWPAIEETLEAAIERMERMRREEGRAMAADLRANAAAAAARVEEIAQRAPLVAEAYRARLAERVQKAIAEFEVTLDPADLVREVTLFADRCDISEELVRLRSHLQQFQRLIEHEESPGRKLDFLTQEMLREANTIGSKANDVEIARHVIEIKTAVERIREMIQNVE